jgi:hypothetical protein
MKLCTTRGVRHAVHMGEMKNAYEIMVGTPEEKR